MEIECHHHHHHHHHHDGEEEEAVAATATAAAATTTTMTTTKPVATVIVRPEPIRAVRPLRRQQQRQQQQQQQQQHQQQQPHPTERVLLRPQPIRPRKPTKRVRPQPVRPIVPSSAAAAASTAFYEAAAAEGCPGFAVHAAILESHEWNRRWRAQEETGHTQPEEEEEEGGSDNHECHRQQQERQQQQQLPRLPHHYAYRSSDFDTRLGGGAKNPSPPGSSDYTSSIPSSISSDDPKPPQSPPPSTTTATEQQIQQQQKQALVVRPVALRIPTPATAHSMVQATASSYRQQTTPLRRRSSTPPPQHLELVPAPRSISPLTAASGLASTDSSSTSSSSRSSSRMRRRQQGQYAPPPSPSPAANGTQLQEQQQQQQQQFPPPALIEPDYDIPTELSIGIAAAALEQRAREIREARDGLLQSLACTKGESDAAENPDFHRYLEELSEHYASTVSLPLVEKPSISSNSQQNCGRQFCVDQSAHNGLWLTLTKPTFFGCLGETDAGDPLYTLGRMSFDMFSPTRVVCSLQGNFNTVEKVPASDDSVPAELRIIEAEVQAEAGGADVVLQTYNIATAFTIEPDLAAYPTAPNKDVSRPIRGIMTTLGYTLPERGSPSGRCTIWITGARIEPAEDEENIRRWRELYGIHPPEQTGWGAKAKALAVKYLLGATIPTELSADGSMSYTFSKPLGGPGKAYIDVLFMDDSLRIVKGHRGTIFVFSRL